MESKLAPAKWEDDCQGKKDYDGEVLGISTRYWPGNYQSNGKISARSSMAIRWKSPEGFRGYDPEYEDLITENFEGDSEAEVKFKVEQWVQSEYEKVSEVIRHFYGAHKSEGRVSPTDLNSDWHILVHKDKPGKFGALYYDENLGGYEILEWDTPYIFLDVSVKGDGVIDLDGHHFPEKDWVDYRIQKVSICVVTDR